MSTGPLNDLGLTAKDAGHSEPSGGCGGECVCGSGGSSAGGCGSNAGGCGNGGACACSSAPAPMVRSDTVIGAPRVSGSRARVSSVLGVTGMTRGRCIATMMNTLERIKGVDSVDVDLNPGGTSVVTVISATDLDPDAVGAEIDAAGFTLVSGPISAS
ncbi:heavy-metal-associated domain-containing protein [Mycetocola zhujimingii]|nr:heavy metal-associated domain-containing protein [Mycetocola zhujimingii]